jgi:hypothetical protein
MAGKAPAILIEANRQVLRPPPPQRHQIIVRLGLRSNAGALPYLPKARRFPIASTV